MSIFPLAASPRGSSPLASSPASGALVIAAPDTPSAVSSPVVKDDSQKTAAKATATKTDKDGQVSAKELKEAVAKLNERLKPFISEAVRFNVDDESGKLIVTVVDTEKNIVLRQIPTEEALAMSRESHLKQPGLLLNTQA